MARQEYSGQLLRTLRLMLVLPAVAAADVCTAVISATLATCTWLQHMVKNSGLNSAVSGGARIGVPLK